MSFIYSFDQLVGNTKTLSLIKKTLQYNTFSNFTILDGIHGTGKTTTSKLIAMFKTCKDENKFETGEPCMKCENCKVNYKALVEGKSSRFIHIYDIGQHTDNINKLITEMFKLQNNDTVYILDEVHRLDVNEQTALLCEIEKAKDSTIIMNTTKAYKLLPELRNRARIHTFKDLTCKESIILIDKIVNANNLELSEDYKDIIAKGTKGIPRQIINDCSFISRTDVTKEEIMNYYALANEKVYLELLNSCKLDIQTFSTIVNDISFEYGADNIVRNMQEFLLNSIFKIEGNIKEAIREKDCSILTELGTNKLMNIINLLEDKTRLNYEKKDLLFIMLKIRNMINNKTEESIIRDKYKEGLKEYTQSSETYKETQELRRDNKPTFIKLDIEGLKDL